jgi:hypothetical protein
MDERQTPDVEQTRRSRVPTVVISVLAAVALFAALYVVVKSLRRVNPEPVPVALRNAPPDTGLVVCRASLRRKARTLEIRCRTTRKQLKDGMSPQQDSLGRECDSAIARFLDHIAAFDSVKREDRKAAADSLKAEYARAKAEVNAFTRFGRGTNEVSEDSLNQELKKLISE